MTTTEARRIVTTAHSVAVLRRRLRDLQEMRCEHDVDIEATMAALAVAERQNGRNTR